MGDGDIRMQMICGSISLFPSHPKEPLENLNQFILDFHNTELHHDYLLLFILHLDSQGIVQKPQLIQIVEIRILSGMSYSEHFIPVLIQLHWFLLSFQFQLKRSAFTSKA